MFTEVPVNTSTPHSHDMAMLRTSVHVDVNNLGLHAQLHRSLHGVDADDVPDYKRQMTVRQLLAAHVAGANCAATAEHYTHFAGHLFSSFASARGCTATPLLLPLLLLL